MKKALICVPTYNERENVGLLAEEIFKNVPENAEILFVDDGSPDGTGDLLDQMSKQNSRIHVLHRKGKLGLATAYLRAFEWGLEKNFDWFFEMDADFSHNPNDLPKLFEGALKGDMSVGSRYCNGVNVVNWPMSRVLLSYFASKYVRLVLGIPVYDTTAGFVCFSRKVLENIGLDEIKMTGYGFQVEMKYKAFRKKYKIVEVPIVFTDRTQGESKMNGGIIKEAIFGVLDMKLKSIVGKI